VFFFSRLHFGKLENSFSVCVFLAIFLLSFLLSFLFIDLLCLTEMCFVCLCHAPSHRPHLSVGMGAEKSGWELQSQWQTSPLAFVDMLQVSICKWKRAVDLRGVVKSYKFVTLKLLKISAKEVR